MISFKQFLIQINESKMPPQSITPGINPDLWNGPQDVIRPTGWENSSNDSLGRIPDVAMWDADGDGEEDREDYDDDNDGVDDMDDMDDDGDGTPDWIDADWLAQNNWEMGDFDTDADFDGIPDYFDSDYEIDHDGDGVPNGIDPDWKELQGEINAIWNDIIPQRIIRPDDPWVMGNP